MERQARQHAKVSQEKKETCKKQTGEATTFLYIVRYVMVVVQLLVTWHCILQEQTEKFCK